MNRFAWALTLTAFAGLARSQEIRGAGSTAAAKLIQEWASAYRMASKSIVGYEGGGSGAGLRRLKAGEVTFAVSDVALSVPELQSGGFAQFPVALGGIVPVVNVPGVAPGQLRLNGELLARLFGAKTAVWNAPEIAALNPGVTLPAQQARIAHRSDSSGSTALFTGYLSRVSAEWKSAVGSAMTVVWSAGSQACEGSDGMADYVAKTPGAIGYVDFSRAQSRGLSAVRLENRSKNFVAPSKAGFQSAAAAFPWAQAPAFSVLLLDQPGAESWPITAPVFIIMPLAGKDTEALRRTLLFFEWALASGEPLTERLGFVAMPGSLSQAVRGAWARQFKGPDGKPLLAAD